MSLHPVGAQLKIVASPPLPGTMDTPVMDGAVFSMVTGDDVSDVPAAVPSVGVAVQEIDWPASKLAPVMLWVVTEVAPLTVHCQV